MLSDGPRAAVGGGLVTVAERLGSPSAAWLVTGDPCTVITQALLSAKLEGDGPSIADQLAAAGPLGHPDAIGVAYARADGPTGRVVLAYPDAAGAAADLAGRTSLARDGSGLLNPLAELFAVAAANVDGPAIVLDLVPPAGATPDSSAMKAFPRRVIDMAIRRDMIYAACTP